MKSMSNKQTKRITETRKMPESVNNENRSMIGSRTEVPSTTSAERQGTPRTTKKTS